MSKKLCMSKKLWLALAVAGTLGFAEVDGAHAVPANLEAIKTAQPASDVQQVARVVVRGRVGVGGRWRVGGRYYGGVWYGTGRRWWGGRWWAYGVGDCWRPSPIGFVWICF